MDFLSLLQQRIIHVIEHNEQEICACAQARVFGTLHTSAIILIQENHDPGSGSVNFRAYVELEDEEHGGCEAELLCTCKRLPGDGAVWQVTRLEVIDASANVNR